MQFVFDVFDEFLDSHMSAAVASTAPRSIRALVDYVPGGVHAEFRLDVLDHGDDVTIVEQRRRNDVAS
ncbi:hypothetical protein TSO221_03215 [Azospirillum sp. TSO22-1]|nr:hypothetical protein TSO221_03215 [Azospirillum sp. TSO22-1]